MKSSVRPKVAVNGEIRPLGNVGGGTPYVTDDLLGVIKCQNEQKGNP